MVSGLCYGFVHLFNPYKKFNLHVRTEYVHGFSPFCFMYLSRNIFKSPSIDPGIHVAFLIYIRGITVKIKYKYK